MDKPALSHAASKRALAIFALIFLFTLPSLWAGLMGDDYMHYAILKAEDLPIEKPDDLSLFGLFSFINGDPERNRRAMDPGVIPWWTYDGMKYAFWRPLAEITHWIDHQLWPRSPALMHLQNVLWYLRMWLLGMFFSLVPATTALPQDRVLTFTGIGASAVLAHFLVIVFRQKAAVGFFPRWSATAVGGLLIVLHLVLSPLLLPIASYGTKIFWSSLISQKPSEFDGIADIEHKRLVLIGSPLASSLAIAPFRFYRGEPIPERIWFLTSLDEEIVISRKSDNEIQLSLESGFIQGPEAAVRDFNRFPFRTGDTISLNGLAITVDNLNEQGKPTRLTLTFDQAIEHSILIFLRWNRATDSYEALQIR
jgi:hypothetical protein